MIAALFIGIVLWVVAAAAMRSLAERDARLAVALPCITCGEPTRRRWYDQPVCYACAGVRFGGAR